MKQQALPSSFSRKFIKTYLQHPNEATSPNIYSTKVFITFDDFWLTWSYIHSTLKAKKAKIAKEVMTRYISPRWCFCYPQTIAWGRCSGNAPDGHNLTALIWKPIPPRPFDCTIKMLPRPFDCTIKKVAKAFWLHDKKVDGAFWLHD